MSFNLCGIKNQRKLKPLKHQLYHSPTAIESEKLDYLSAAK